MLADSVNNAKTKIYFALNEALEMNKNNTGRKSQEAIKLVKVLPRQF